MSIDPEGCVLCQTSDPGEDSWTEWGLPEPIRWRGAFTDANEPPIPARRWKACPPCSAWIPRARTGHMPATLQRGIHEAVWSVELHPTTRRALHADITGRARHLAQQLRPVKQTEVLRRD